MANYTEISRDVALDILELYNIKGVRDLIPLSFGISNTNYRVNLDSGDAVILKISNDKGRLELAEEQKILQYLKQNGFPYSLSAYLTNEGQSVYEYDEYCGVVFPFVNGEVPTIEPESLAAIGAALAELHLTSDYNKNFQNLRPHTSVGFDLKTISEYTKTEKCPTDFKAAFDEIFPAAILEQAVNSELPYGVIHGDLYYDNTLFRDGQLQAMLDFEQSGVGEYLFDIGVSISGSCLEGDDISLPLVEHFMDGYSNVRRLTAKEDEFLYYAILAGLFSISRWRIKRFVENELDPSKRDNYKQLIHRALRFHQKIKK
jgi:homoserine kinase type II